MGRLRLGRRLKHTFSSVPPPVLGCIPAAAGPQTDIPVCWLDHTPGTMNNVDLRALRDYVTADTGVQNQAESTVRLVITHSNLKAKFMEIRLDMHMTIDSVKRKLCFHCGTSPSAMVLYLRDERGNSLATLADDARMLGFFSPRDGYVLHILDTDPTSASANGWLEDTGKVEKYVMSDEDYDKRDNTYRKYKQERLKEDPTWTVAREMAERRARAAGGAAPPAPAKEKVDDEEHQAEEAAAAEVGARCEVQSSEGGKRGEVKFVGKCEGLPLGWWVGVAYDEPVGKNDGSVKGKRYFQCLAGYGAFVRPNLVKTGDFPPHDDEFEFESGDEI